MSAIGGGLKTGRLEARSTGAYTNVRKDLTQRGFEWVQGSGSFGEETVAAVSCLRVTQRLAKTYVWLRPCAKDLRMLRIEKNNALLAALTEEDDD